MSTVEVGKKVPDFELPATSDLTFRLADYKGKKVVIYFYPKDNTPGCTSEGQDFRDLYPEFAGENTVIFGVSRDGLRAHENFRAKFHFPFELLSDGDELACKLFDVLHEKVMYGRRVPALFLASRSPSMFSTVDSKCAPWRTCSYKSF